jgi:predicted phage replisome organizer
MSDQDTKKRKPRYWYWLRLQNGFFKNPVIKKMRRIAGGDTYVIIYLKLLLLALPEKHETLDRAGFIVFENIEDDFAEELSLKIDEDVENIRVVLVFLEKHGLLRRDTEFIYSLPEAVENIGRECDSAARTRLWRKGRLELPSPGGAEQEQDTEVHPTSVQEEEEEQYTDASPQRHDVTHYAEYISIINKKYPALRISLTKNLQQIFAGIESRGLLDNLLLELAVRGANDGAAFVARLASGECEADFLALPTCTVCGRHVERVNEWDECAACAFARWKENEGNPAEKQPEEIW